MVFLTTRGGHIRVLEAFKVSIKILAMDSSHRPHRHILTGSDLKGLNY